MPQNCGIPHESGCKFADHAAEKAVKMTFSILGVDVDRPESVEAFREDLRFGKGMRKFADRSGVAFAGIIAAAVTAALWFGVIAKIKEALL